MLLTEVFLVIHAGLFDTPNKPFSVLPEVEFVLLVFLVILQFQLLYQVCYEMKPAT